MNIIIDGKSCSCEKGEYLLQIARRNGIEIPTLCHHDGFPGQGSCRLCMVEAAGCDRLLPACRTKAAFLGSAYCSSARCMAFSRGDRATYTGFMVTGSRPVWYMQVLMVPGVG